MFTLLQLASKCNGNACQDERQSTASIARVRTSATAAGQHQTQRRVLEPQSRRQSRAPFAVSHSPKLAPAASGLLNFRQSCQSLIRKCHYEITNRCVISAPRCVSASLVEIARFGLSGVWTLNLPRISVLFRSDAPRRALPSLGTVRPLGSFCGASSPRCRTGVDQSPPRTPALVGSALPPTAELFVRVPRSEQSRCPPAQPAVRHLA